MASAASGACSGAPGTLASSTCTTAHGSSATCAARTSAMASVSASKSSSSVPTPPEANTGIATACASSAVATMLGPACVPSRAMSV